MVTYVFKKNIKLLKRRRDNLIKLLRGIKPFVDGSYVEVRRRCGKDKCKCTKGEKHKGLYLMYKEKKKTKAVYIPVDMQEEVKGWVQEYRRIKGVVKEICKLQKEIIRRYIYEKRLKRGRG